MLEMSAYLQEQDGFTSSYPEIRDILHDSIAHVANMKGRRIIKTHLPFEFLPPKLVDTCKVLYVCRNPADAAVSNYKYLGNIFRGSFPTFIKMFCKGVNCELTLLFGVSYYLIVYIFLNRNCSEWELFGSSFHLVENERTSKCKMDLL